MSESVVVEENPLEGLNFLEVFQRLLKTCPSSDPGLRMFQAALKAVEAVHVRLGLPFSASEYWNVGTIRGSHAVLPVFNEEVPENITEADLEDYIKFSESLSEAQNEIVNSWHQVSRARPAPDRATLHPSHLTRAVASAQMFIAIATDSEEDDFL